MNLLLLSIYVVVTAAQDSELEPRIVGGAYATEGQFPYQVSLQSRAGQFHFCGGTIISTKTVVTAAHCRVTTMPLRSIRVMVGSVNNTNLNATRYKVSKFIVHPDYNATTLIGDIAVIIIRGIIKFTDLVHPVSLVNRTVPIGEKGIVTSGWGYTAYPYPSEGPPTYLKYLYVNILPEKNCSAYTIYLEGKICTLNSKDNGACSGDSGGGLVTTRGELIGVASSAFLCATGQPDFFTNVYRYRSFVEQNIS